MAEEARGGKPGAKDMPLSAIFLFDGLVSPERRRALVVRVLSEFSGLPVGVKSALRSAVNDEVVPTSGGFRKGQAGRALDRSSFLLQEPLLQSVAGSDIMAGAVLQCWAESHPSLREAVERHLTGRGLTTPGPDLHGRLFRGRWLLDQWEAERESFTQTYADDFEADDVGLMLCYVSGNFPPLAQDDSGDPADLTLDDALSAALSSLRELSATAADWERKIPDFVASVSRVIEEKAAQLRWHEEFDSILHDVRATYLEMLQFFEQDTHNWVAARVSQDAGAESALRLARKLLVQLAEYQPIHDRAPGISEEQERVQKRASLQPSILGTLQDLASFMTGEIVEDRVKPAASYTLQPPPVPAGRPDSGSTGLKEPLHPASLEPESPPREPEHPQSPQVQEAQSALTASPSITPIAVAGESGATSPELVSLQSANVELREGSVALRSENQGLKDEVEALKTELFGSQEREDSWRLAYRSAMDGSLEEVGVAPPLVESVLDAVEMAKGRFRQELLFAPNSESSIEDNPFIDPARVWEALQWLGTTYYASRMGRLRVTDFDQSIKEACGWWYKSDQGETTVSRYEKSYTTRADGKRYTLVEHIGKGTTFDARYTIRIAFDWDRDKRQVVIGYIGRHQQTDAS